MTRKDFELIARGIRRQVDFLQSLEDFTTAPERLEAAKTAITMTVDMIAHELRQANPKFDAERFYAACGLPYRVAKAAA